MIEKKLAAPFCAIKVTGALFHTQGGLAIDTRARVLRAQRQAVPESVRGRRRGGRRVGLAGVGLSVGQWPAHRDGVRPHRRGNRRPTCERQKSGGSRAPRSPYPAEREESRHDPFRTRPQSERRNDIADRVAALDWGKIATQLDAFGCATPGRC